MEITSIILSYSQQILMLLIGIFGIGFIIGFHELGHFLMCKLFGVSVPSFSIGMGPKLFTKKIGETEFSLSAIPLGGYVEIAGQDPEKPTEPGENNKLFTDKPFYKKLAIFSGGIIFNFIFAYLVFVLLFSVGMPKNILSYPSNATNKISQIITDSPAEKAGLKIGDQIISVNHIEVEKNGAKVLEEVYANKNKEVYLSYERDNKQYTAQIQLGSLATGKVLGALLEMKPLPPMSFAQSLKQSFRFSWHGLTTICATFKSLLNKNNIKNIGGPIRILSETSKSASKGYKNLLFLLAIISLNLLFINLLPLPIFDGGQAVLFGIEALIRKPLPEKVREYIAIGCWVLVLGLYLILTVSDLWSIFFKH
ncbi:PDZ domain-containing protein [bacterium]|jgi:regulator of sigma E protease|nr:PDZ domain-containing protein [bacterium]